MDTTTLDLLIAYVEAFLSLFAAAGNSVVGIIAAIVGFILTLFQDGTLN